jgi:hypothetical protein
MSPGLFGFTRTRAAIQDHKPLPEIVRRLLHGRSAAERG